MIQKWFLVLLDYCPFISSKSWNSLWIWEQIFCTNSVTRTALHMYSKLSYVLARHSCPFSVVFAATWHPRCWGGLLCCLELPWKGSKTRIRLLLHNRRTEAGWAAESSWASRLYLQIDLQFYFFCFHATCAVWSFMNYLSISLYRLSCTYLAALIALCCQ